MEQDSYSITQMRSGPVVADLASQLKKCVHCANPLPEFTDLHLCSKCGLPQPIALLDDYFSGFGLVRKFNQDESELQKRFYALSRLLHPDRFTTSSLDAKALALQQMSWLNQAFSTLKDFASRREYLLKLEGVQAVPSGQTEKTHLPLALAEKWFEIQDLLLEDPSKVKPILAEFEAELEATQQKLESNLRELEVRYDRLRESSHKEEHEEEEHEEEIQQQEILNQMAKDLQLSNYLKSLEKNVERIKQNAYSD